MIDKPEAFWAVIEHHRNWLSTDGAHFLEVIDAGSLTEPIARRIVREYAVARNIGLIEDDDGRQMNGLARLVQEINASQWPQELPDRAEVCIKLAKAHYDRGVGKRRHRPISGVSKLMWFLRPTGWTMFDGYARIGLIGNNRNANADRINDVTKFYKTLDLHNFKEISSSLTDCCKNYGFTLFGERIVDKLLLFRGWNLAGAVGEGYFDTAQTLNHRHLQLLPSEYGKKLSELADKVAGFLTLDRFRISNQ